MSMGSADGQRAWPGLPELAPTARTPRWRRWTAGLLIGVPAVVTIVADTTAYVQALAADPAAAADLPPNGISGWTGLALCAIWLAALVRAILPLARVARWIEGACAAVVVGVMVQRLDVAGPWVAVGLGAVAAALLILVLRRPARRTARIPAPAPAQRAAGDRASVVFSETSATPSRALLVALGCAGFAALGVVQVVLSGPIGWWYVVAAVVWLTGSVPWMLRVTLDRSGLVVRSLVLPFALLRVPLAEIADATAGIVHPRHWGGTGLLADGGVTSILRAEGAALVVTRIDGTQVVVTVERPDVAVDVLDELRARGGAAGA